MSVYTKLIAAPSSVLDRTLVDMTMAESHAPTRSWPILDGDDDSNDNKHHCHYHHDNDDDDFDDDHDDSDEFDYDHDDDTTTYLDQIVHPWKVKTHKSLFWFMKEYR
jgi:hypothetical protein